MSDWREVSAAEIPIDAEILITIGGDRVTQVSAKAGETVRIEAKPDG